MECAAEGARGFVFADRVVSSLPTERDSLRLCGAETTAAALRRLEDAGGPAALSYASLTAKDLLFALAARRAKPKHQHPYLSNSEHTLRRTQ